MHMICAHVNLLCLGLCLCCCCLSAIAKPVCGHANQAYMFENGILSHYRLLKSCSCDGHHQFIHETYLQNHKCLLFFNLSSIKNDEHPQQFWFAESRLTVTFNKWMVKIRRFSSLTTGSLMIQSSRSYSGRQPWEFTFAYVVLDNVAHWFLARFSEEDSLEWAISFSI